jgi:hypothetical protein
LLQTPVVALRRGANALGYPRQTVSGTQDGIGDGIDVQLAGLTHEDHAEAQAIECRRDRLLDCLAVSEPLSDLERPLQMRQQESQPADIVGLERSAVAGPVNPDDRERLAVQRHESPRGDAC